MEKEQIKERLSRLKKAMQEQNIALYIIPMSDYHGSEYIGDYFKLIRYFSGFTGSAGTLVVTETEVYLWTDGRYFLQAEQQLCGTGILLQKMGERDVPAVSDFVTNYFSRGNSCEGKAVGFDGRLVSSAFAEKLGDLPKISEKDLAGDVWEQEEEEKRPAISKNPVWILDEKYSGQKSSDKLALIREDMKREAADVLLLSTLDDIAYLTNLRGGDIEYNPVFLSYMKIDSKEAVLYSFIVDPEIENYLKENGICMRPYENFYKDIQEISKEKCVWLDVTSASYCMLQTLPKECKKITKANPVIGRKAVKNATEIENIKIAHQKDGVAVTKFIYWLKTFVCTGKVPATEMSAAEHLIGLRGQQAEYLGESFAPILAYAEHGAIVHYSADETTDAELKPHSFLLADTGGHYRNGTTDVTRTIAMGELTAKQKEYYTAVLKGNLRLTSAKFKLGTMGAHLDYLAREPLYRLGMDFRHGTGHGVGYLLSVHEGPNGFRMRQEADSAFKAGMVTSNEPGLYLDGQYGIRLENLILCVEEEKTEYGQFLSFEPLTMVPFDRDAIASEMLSQEEKERLNAYHKKVYDTISQELTEEERQWLFKVTAPI